MKNKDNFWRFPGQINDFLGLFRFIDQYERDN